MWDETSRQHNRQGADASTEANLMPNLISEVMSRPLKIRFVEPNCEGLE
jgi:hypothetical protein